MSELKACPFCGRSVAATATTLSGEPTSTTCDWCIAGDGEVDVGSWNSRTIEDSLRAENLGLAKSLLEAEKENERLAKELLQKTQQVKGWKWMHDQRNADYRAALAANVALTEENERLGKEVERLKGNWKLSQQANDSLYRKLSDALATVDEVKGWRHDEDASGGLEDWDALDAILSAAPTKGEKV